MMATLYVGNLEFRASTKELKDELDEVFRKIHVEDVVIQRKDGRSPGYAFVTLSWARANDCQSTRHLQDIFGDVRC